MENGKPFESGTFLVSLKEADLSFCDCAASFLQSGFWGAFKARFGWEALAFRAVWKGEGPSEEKPLLVLRRSLAAGGSGIFGFSLAYIPWGPELPAALTNREEALHELSLSLKKILPEDTVFLRFDPPWYTQHIGFDEYKAAEKPDAFSPPFVRSGADIQPPDTVLIDLKQPMESIIGEMKSKWRYNARLALKKGVTVRRAGAEEAGVFYELLKTTSRRDGIAIHSLEYYQTILGGVIKSEAIVSRETTDTRLYLAEHEGELLAGIVTLFRGREAVYLYGASSDKKRSLMAPYALQLKAMEDAKEAGCELYDLFGIPPDEDPSHPMAGLYRFKTGFGGKIVHRPGSWDFPYRPLVYRLFRGAETLRKNLRTIKKRIKKLPAPS